MGAQIGRRPSIILAADVDDCSRPMETDEEMAMVARCRLDVWPVRAGVVSAVLALINLASRSSEPCFPWPAGVLLVGALLWRAWKASP